MSNPLIWNMSESNPFSFGESSRVPPAPILGNLDREWVPPAPIISNLDRELLYSPGLPPDSTTRGRSLSGSSEVELSRCSACPSPGLVPPSAMVSHVVSCHRGQGFQCAACKHMGVNIQLLGYEELKEHIRQAHKVTSEELMPSAIILPSSLVQWRCALCAGARVWLGEELARDHIATVHGTFYLKKANVYCMPSCRLCTVEGSGLAEHVASAHPRDAYADQEEDDVEVPSLETVQQDPILGDRNVSEHNTSARSVSVRSDLFPDQPGSSTRRSPSRGNSQVKLSPRSRSRSSSIEIVCEKSVSGTRKEVGRKTVVKKESSHKRKKVRQSSSSDSSSDSSNDERKMRKKKPSPGSKWLTNIDKYLPSGKRRETPSSSPSPAAKNKSKPPGKDLTKSPGELSTSTSPEYRAQLSSPESPSRPGRNKSPVVHNPQLPRSTTPPAGYSRRNSIYKSQRRKSSRSPQRRVSRTPPRRVSRTPPRRFSRTSPRRFSKSPPRRNSRSSPGRFSRSPSRAAYSRRSRSPFRPKSRSLSRENNERSRYDTLKPNKKANGQGRIRDDTVDCTICGITCVNKVQFNQHKLGQRHKEAALKAGIGISSQKLSFSISSRPPVASFGKGYCTFCKTTTEEKHQHCDVCEVHSTSNVTHNQHMEGKKHLEKVKKYKRKEEFMQVKSAPRVPDLDNTSVEVAFPNQKHCPACEEIFSDLKELTTHVRENHNIFISCKECKVLKHPAFEALTCEELVDHLKKDHLKTNVSDADLKYYGEVPNWSQGYIKCKMCPPLKLGNNGFWLDNDVNKLKIRKHFTSYHSKHTFNALSHLTLGCQVCSTTVSHEKMQTWHSHIASHKQVQAPAQEVKGGTGTTSLCAYCCTNIHQSEEQDHTKSHHSRLAFSCKLCPVSSRFFYKDYVDIIRHLKLKHSGNNPHQNIIFPGDQKNMQDFAWVKCKTSGCEFKGLGLGQEVQQHLNGKHKGGGLQDFNIFCRICDKDERSIFNYDDADDFVEHMKKEHSDIIQHLPPYRDWSRGSNLEIGV